MSSKKPLEDIIQRLKVDGGRPDFENAVADAFNFLSFQVEIIPDTQAESDLIVKAYLPQNPYFVIVECSAVREGSFVSYQKLGQIRGNAPKYFLQYGKELPSYYKIIVGRPAFSGDTKKHALNDVVLLTVNILIKLLESHNIYQFSQDELRIVFETKGEVDEERIAELTKPYLKNLKTCALVMMGLLIEPTRNPDQRRKEWLDINQLVGRVDILSWFLDVDGITPTDAIRAINELSSPLKSIIQLSENEKLRLTSIPFEVVTEKMGRQGTIFREILSDFRLKAISMKSPKPKEIKF
jgi:hypothetical protein